MTTALQNRHPDLVRQFSEQGFFLRPGAFAADRVRALKAALQRAVVAEAPLRRPADDPAQVVCCPWHDDLFLQVLSEGGVFADVDRLLGPDCILYNYNNSCMPPGAGNFSSHIHVERGYSTGNWLEGVGVLVLLDDFTIDNGASWFLPGSWLREQAPAETEFLAGAERLLAPAGSLFYFHPHLWHSGGINRTTQSREALSIGFCRPHLKQRIDYPALFAARRQDFPADVVQKLGFLAQPPRSVDAFYRRGGGWRSEESPVGGSSG
ncbi:MAG: phytanoyl-CoA dioxygenase family protein [Pseudomonadota bacterium]